MPYKPTPTKVIHAPAVHRVDVSYPNDLHRECFGCARIKALADRTADDLPGQLFRISPTMASWTKGTRIYVSPNFIFK
jgi:hypothetical protein